MVNHVSIIEEPYAIHITIIHNHDIIVMTMMMMTMMMKTKKQRQVPTGMQTLVTDMNEDAISRVFLVGDN